jgi:hypothetical protein
MANIRRHDKKLAVNSKNPVLYYDKDGRKTEQKLICHNQ